MAIMIAIMIFPFYNFIIQLSDIIILLQYSYKKDDNNVFCIRRKRDYIPQTER